MRKRSLVLAYAIALLLSVCASSNTADVQEESTNEISVASSVATTTEAVPVTETDEDNSDSEDTSDINVDSSNEADYKQAYKKIIEYEQERIASVSPETSPEEYEDCIDCYWLYDIDKDNIPELLIRYGHSEAAFHGKLYTCVEGKAQLITDEVSMGHTSFYAVPDENGILSYWGHMGCAACFKLVLKKGKLESEELYSEDINEKLQAGEDVWYKASNEIVDGAYYLEEYDYDSTYPIEMYDVVADYSNGEIKATSFSYSFPDNNPDFYTDIMQNDGIVNAIALDQFMNTLGEVSFGSLLEEGRIYEYTQGNLEAHGITYADLNSDGIYECIVYLSEGDDKDKDYRVIMSLQDDTVFAYLTFYPGETTITENGYFITEPGEYTHERYVKRVLYDMDYCFTYSVPSENS